MGRNLTKNQRKCEYCGEPIPQELSPNIKFHAYKYSSQGRLYVFCTPSCKSKYCAVSDFRRLLDKCVGTSLKTVSNEQKEA